MSGIPTTTPPSDERRLLHSVKNHAQFRNILEQFNLKSDLASYDSHVLAVVRGWFSLGREHLVDARAAVSAKRVRAVYSRAYYAAYNCSKAVRYRVNGFVSLTGDDHKKCGDLPDDFPDLASWARRLVEMHIHRLRADYDNWQLTSSENTMTPQECVKEAEAFIGICEQYLATKFGETI